jgi:hypothetical protein
MLSPGFKVMPEQVIDAWGPTGCRGPTSLETDAEAGGDAG